MANPQVEHVMRRAGFGMGTEERVRFFDMSVPLLIDLLVNFERQADDVDEKVGQRAYASITTRGRFSPYTNIEDARQLWLFRMIHSGRPLQEKMALFWHNHFATAYSKVAGIVGGAQATKMMMLKDGELSGPRGQIELFRQFALGNFRDLLIEVARDPAMLVWLDGRLNTRQRPQENFGREVMELFTFGVGNYTEQDVYAAARVFTGWSIRFVNGGNDSASYYETAYNANNHDGTEKTFTFPIYSNGSRSIPARSTADGAQDVADFLTALARHPQTARRLAAKLWNFFISEVEAPSESFVRSVVDIYLQSNTEMRPVVRYILRSQWFMDRENFHARYSWPVEYVVRAIKETGWNGFSVDTARTPLANMGQNLFEPPDVNGWDLGRGWFSTGAMLARMNFASTLAANQRFNLARDAGAFRSSADNVMGYFMSRFTPAPFDSQPRNELMSYLNAGGSWSGSDAQVNARAAGLTRLILGSAEYQFV
jgi:uncharacterized protein (DUF1800 family)